MPRSLGAVDEELARARALEARLDPELQALRALGLPLRDWRQLAPEEVVARCRNAHAAAPEHRALIARAIFVGTAQACFRGSYWAPSYRCPSAEEVSCRHLRPISRLYPISKALHLDGEPLEEGTGLSKISCHARRHPLDACSRIAEAHGPMQRRIAIVHFTAAGDARNESASYRHLFEDQLFLRTTYFHAFERMAADIGEPVGEAITAGGIVYTPDVGILRKSLEEGAAWSRDPTRIDVIWAGLEPRPALEEQSQYAFGEDAASMSATIERVLALAASQEVEVIVFPPLGCGTHGCSHPALDVAQLLREAVACYGRHFAEVAFASDSPTHLLEGWWEQFVDALVNGRPPIAVTAPVEAPPFSVLRKDAAALAGKQRRLLQRRERHRRETFL